jgi:hypothetical protein
MEEHLDTARLLLRILEPLFYRREPEASVSELSFAFSPQTIHVIRYRQRYQALKDFMAEAGIETEQPITSERRY